jgi:ABC-2 type transport system permease protein
VLLATAKPESLMAGKLLGVGAAGLTQIGIWFALISILTGSAAAMRAGMGGGLTSFGITSLQLVFFALYFILGFLFYSAISAGFGASVSTEQEVQQFSFVIVMPLMVGLIMMTYVLSNPSAPLSVAMSLFPPCTPVVMYLRLCSQQPPIWQLLLSVVLMLLAIWAAIWVASRIYRVGILMYGKRATLPEMLRWMRYS